MVRKQRRTDGISWTGRGATIIQNSVRGIAYGKNGSGNNLWVAVGSVGSGENTIATSTDAITWTGLGSTTFTTIGLCVAYANSLWVAGGQGGIVTSTDGTTWTNRNTGYIPKSITYGNGTWVAATGSSEIVTSNNAVTWTLRSGTGTNESTYVAYGNNMWIVSNQYSISKSTNGTNWTQYNTYISNYLTMYQNALAPPNVAPTLSSLATIAPRALGSGNFTITAPTTNSDGFFTYTSSNTAVATIAGNTVTMVGKGSTTITAILNNTKQFKTASVSTVFGVYTSSTYSENNINYTYYDGLGTATVNSSNSATGDINILTTFDVNGTTYTVTSIDAHAFNNRPITSVTIPNTVTSIGVGAFWTTNIASITIPSSVMFNCGFAYRSVSM